MTVWTDYRKCPACLAELGKPCKSIDGTVVNGVVTELRLTVREEPHTTRKLRAESARTGGNR